jgi:hypothetical protein
MREKSVLVGAGSAMLTRGPAADLLRRGWKCELGLVDVDREAMAMAGDATGGAVCREGAVG